MTRILDTPQEILEKCSQDGFWIHRGANFNEHQFVEFCNSISTPWPEELYKLHSESINDDELVLWSNSNSFGNMSLPWHSDNAWHPDYWFPLRVLYGVKIHQNDTLSFLNTAKWFHDQPPEFQDYLRSLKVLTQCYKGGCQPFWKPFIKKHPITGRENFHWGAMRVGGRNVFGLQHPEGWPAPRFSFTMAIEKPNRDLVLDDEICDWFESMINEKYLYTHKYEEGDIVIIDNSVSMHYRPPLVATTERLFWRKTLLQPWQKL